MICVYTADLHGFFRQRHRPGGALILHRHGNIERRVGIDTGRSVGRCWQVAAARRGLYPARARARRHDARHHHGHAGHTRSQTRGLEGQDKRLAPYAPLRTGTKYKIIGKYKNGTEVVLLEKTTSSWYKMLTPDGKPGYMSTDWLQYVRTEVTPGQGEAVNEVVEPRQLRDQPFRIYRAVPELDKITVYARHVFYDLMDNMIRKYEPSATTTGANVAQGIANGCLSEHDCTFYSDLDSTAEEVVFENVNLWTPSSATAACGEVRRRAGAGLV